MAVDRYPNRAKNRLNSQRFSDIYYYIYFSAEFYVPVENGLEKTRVPVINTFKYVWLIVTKITNFKGTGRNLL